MKQRSRKHQSDLYKLLAALFLMLSFIYGYFAYFTLDIVLVYRDFGVNLLAPVTISLFSSVSLLMALKLYVLEKKIWQKCMKVLAVFPLLSAGLSSLLLMQYDFDFTLLSPGVANSMMAYTTVLVIMFVLSFTTLGLLWITRDIFLDKEKNKSHK